MKITSVETFVVDAGWRPWLFVKVATDEGVVGYGECSDCWSPQPHGIVGTIKDLTPLLLGQDPRPYERRVWDLLYSTRQSPGGIAAKAIAGIECALVDIKAKALGISVVELFGGPMRERIRLYWSHCGTTRARYAEYVGAPPINTLADIAALGREVVQRGFTALKTNVVIPREQSQAGFGELAGLGSEVRGTDQIVTTPLLRHIERLIGTFRDAVGPDVDINLDLNFLFKPESATRIAQVVEPFALLWLEVDMYDPAGIRQIKEATTTKICTGENLFHPREYLPYFEQRAADVFMVDVPWNGFSQAKEGRQSGRAISVQRCSPQLLQPPGNVRRREPVRRAAQRPHHGSRRRRRAVEGRARHQPAGDRQRRHDGAHRPRLGHGPQRRRGQSAPLE